jgi:hypothetical protein
MKVRPLSEVKKALPRAMRKPKQWLQDDFRSVLDILVMYLSGYEIENREPTIVY